MTELQIIEGRKYVTRGESITGAITKNTVGAREWLEQFPWMDSAAPNNCWRADGRFITMPSDMDLVSEYIEPTTQEAGPVRTETRMVIVPGTYGIITVGEDGGDRNVQVWLPSGRSYFTHAELRAASAVFLALADALENQP